MSARFVKTTRRKVAAPEILVIGDFRITRLATGKVWLQYATGEGMQTTEAKLEAVLEKFWRKEF